MLSSAASKRPWLQFSLRAFLLATVLVAVVLGLWIASAREQARRLAEIQSAGGIVHYDHQWRASDDPLVLWGGHYGKRQSPWPAWLVAGWRRDLFHRVGYVHLGGPSADDRTLAAAVNLPGLKVLTIAGAATTNEGFAALPQASSLEIVHLERMPLGDEVIESLAALTHLRGLKLESLDVTESGLRRLESMTGLDWLALHYLKVSPEAVERVRVALPKCRLIYTPHGDYHLPPRERDASDDFSTRLAP